MKCWKCGAELQEGSRFCGSCGSQQAQRDDPFAGPAPSAPPLPRVDLNKSSDSSEIPGGSGGGSGGQGGPNPGGGQGSGGDLAILLTVFAAVCGAAYGFFALQGLFQVLQYLFRFFLPNLRYGIFSGLFFLIFSLLFTVTSLWMCAILLMLAFRRTRRNSDGLILCLGSGAAAIVILRVLYMLVCLIIPSMSLNFSHYLGTLLRSIAGAAVALGGVYCILRFLLGEMPLAGKTAADFQNDVREAFQSSAKAAGEAGAQAARAAQNARNDWNARQTPPSPAGGGVMRLKADRSLLLYILLNFITCGIYGLYFIYALARDVNVACDGDGRNTAGLLKLVLLSLITCGIYAIFWYYNLANRLAYNAPRYGLSFQENGTTILLWYLVGLLLCGLGPWVAMYIIIKNTNALCGAYNYRHGM